MSMIWPPHRVKIVSTPSAFSALATRWPPDSTLPSRRFCASVSSAVLVVVVDIIFLLYRLSPPLLGGAPRPRPPPPESRSGVSHSAMPSFAGHPESRRTALHVPPGPACARAPDVRRARDRLPAARR